MNDKKINYLLEILKLGLSAPILKPNKPNAFFRCCFHPNDDTPSLSINLENGLYRCFSCNSSGNFFTLVRHLKGDEYYYENYSNKEEIIFTKKSFEINKEYTREVKEEILDKYKKIHSWVLGRFNGNKDLLKYFEIGYDETRNAITIPLRDANGVFYNIEYRHLTGINKSSYLYEFNKKGKILYNLHNVKNYNEVFLVEGAFDAIRMHQSGFKNTVAFLGTELTEERISLLNNYFSILYLSFDNDTAGKKISKQIIDKFKDSKEIYYLDYSLINKKDPGECTEEEIKFVYNNKKLIV